MTSTHKCINDVHGWHDAECWSIVTVAHNRTVMILSLPRHFRIMARIAHNIWEARSFLSRYYILLNQVPESPFCFGKVKHNVVAGGVVPSQRSYIVVSCFASLETICSLAQSCFPYSCLRSHVNTVVLCLNDKTYIVSLLLPFWDVGFVRQCSLITVVKRTNTDVIASTAYLCQGWNSS